MAGETWLTAFQIGKESTYGTPVAATRKLYLESDGSFTPAAENRPHHFAVKRRANVLANTHGPQEPAGTVSLPMSADETLELFDITVATASTSGAGPYVHTFTPGNAAPSSGTIEWDDGARAWQLAGCYGNNLRFTGSANGDNMVTVDLFGKALVANPLTGALADRTPTFMEGWQTELYLDAIGGTPGTTLVSNTLVNWDISFNNQLQRKYTANNSNSMTRAVIGELEAQAQLVFEASEAISLTEFNHWLNNDAGRLVQLKFILAGGTYHVKVTIPGDWATVDLGQTDAGTRVYQMTLGYRYDSVLAAGFQVVATSSRATLY